MKLIPRKHPGVYTSLKALTDAKYAGIRERISDDAIILLQEAGFGVRQDDGELIERNFSIPTSKKGIVFGLRYRKHDGSYSEDLFLFEPSDNVTAGYKGKLEKKLLEYSGTHKALPNI